ncbi:DNA gyrase subunit A [Flammeovirga kamogawensis]|uniref:DNA gyrase subunit A n=1 Tax=Flammeovirga kamogawensis TaxID=373891 RepID=A0ABX8GRR0_9BACT|nr:DNA gyrase subunit A [Flammeovirga kamogawensis]MBB6463168.1 DNA gyrase subunit A [Flammeovirga kamogawensis]QWG05978.1 DNA gyrase subunit A [Flammeovirga kamogawensis]TRX67805.1 DNA gyrase subunit A [Flammeovirga kamogawensis]
MADENIISINIEDEMKSAYIDYSMSVIVSRALPDVRDGLKPVHRRVLYGMAELGLSYNRSYKKSARIVGEVLGKYHPHGDSSVYETMVRMAQPWSLRYTLVDGQGNFGSIDGDSPAAMRYTEARMKEIAGEMLADIKKDTVDFEPNFDDSLKEPSVMPARIPNLLLNGASGIAVGMATNMAPHNMTEVCDAIISYVDNPDITMDELTEIVKGPDFPTGAIIYGYDGVKKALETGRGRVVMRAVTEFEPLPNGREQIVVSEIPYMVNKANMIEKTAELVNDKKIEGISAIRDESDKRGIRIVYELKKDAISDVVLNHLFKQTALQSSFSVNNIALVKGRPRTLNLHDMIKHYVDHRHDVIIRRTQFELAEAERRLHILEGYLKALDNLDEVIALIRGSKDAETAKAELISRFEFSDIQAKAILEMRLQRLTGLERDKINQEHAEVSALVDDLRDILARRERQMDIIRTDLVELKDKYGDERRSKIVYNADDLDIEDLIADEEMVITISHEGYIKRTPLKEYKSQGRGGVGSRGASTKSDDFTEHLFVASNHNYLLLFTNLGRVYWQKVFRLPEGSKTAKGRPLQNLLNIREGEKVQAVICTKNLSDQDYINNHYLMMLTEKGIVKKTVLEAYSRPRRDGINAININEGDKLFNVMLTDGQNDVVIATRMGMATRFNEEKVRSMGRGATGVKGIVLKGDEDAVVGMACIAQDELESKSLMVISENGFGKRTLLEEYPLRTNRGGKGVKAMQVTDKTGKLSALFSVEETDDLIVITKDGITIRTAVSNFRTMGRATQGVKAIRLNDKDEISSVEIVPKIEDEEIEDVDLNTEGENSEGTSENPGNETPDSEDTTTEE